MKYTKNSNTTHIRAFSLLEIIIALAIVALIGGVLMKNLGGIFGRSQNDVARLEISRLDTPLMTYRINIGSYPTTEEGLKALTTAPSGKEKRWKGPYVDELPEDPWGRPYQYKYPGEKNRSST